MDHLNSEKQVKGDRGSEGGRTGGRKEGGRDRDEGGVGAERGRRENLTYLKHANTNNSIIVLISKRKWLTKCHLSSNTKKK